MNKDIMSKEEEKKVTDRINELYHKKEREGLTPAEEQERKELHKKFIANFRAAFKQDVEDMVIMLLLKELNALKEEKDLEKIN